MLARSSSVIPRQIPCGCRVRSANARHWRRTGQRAQIAFAYAMKANAAFPAEARVVPFNGAQSTRLPL